jgi:hypothetical protein
VRGEGRSEKGAGSRVFYGSYMSGKKEFGVKYDTEVTDMGVPRDDGVLEAKWCWGDVSIIYRIRFTMKFGFVFTTQVM